MTGCPDGFCQNLTHAGRGPGRGFGGCPESARGGEKSEKNTFFLHGKTSKNLEKTRLDLKNALKAALSFLDISVLGREMSN